MKKVVFRLLLIIALLNTNLIARAQTLLRDEYVAGYETYYSNWLRDLSGFDFKVDGAGNDYLKYYYPGARYPWNGEPYWSIPGLSTALYAQGIGSPWGFEPDVKYNYQDVNFDVDSAGNRYYVFDANGGDSASANGIVFHGGIWTISFNGNSFRWAKENIGMVKPDNQGNAYYISNDSIVKLNGMGTTVFASHLGGGAEIISPDQAGGVFIKVNNLIKHINPQGIISWSRGYFNCVSDPRGNLYLQVTSDSTIKVDRFNNNVWKRKRNIIGHTFDYNGNSYNGALTKYNAWGNIVWQYCHTGGGAIAMDIEASNKIHILSGVNGMMNYYNSDLANYVGPNSAYFIQVIGQGAAPYEIKILPNDVVLSYLINGWPQVCQCSLTYVPFTTECKQFNSGNVFTLWLCDNNGNNCIKLSELAATSDGIFTNVGIPSIRPGNRLKITSTNPVITSSLFEYPIYAGDFTDYKLIASQTTPACDSVYVYATQTDCYGNYNSYLKKNGVIIDSLYNSTTYYVKSSGNYSIAMNTIGVSCPRETDTIPLLVSQPASSSVSIVGSSIVCAGQTVNLKATVNTPMFRWERNGLYIPGSDNQQNYYASQTGFYRVYAYDSLGCNKYSAAKKATVGIGVVSISTNGSTTFCNGDSVGFGVDQLTGYTYQWKKNGVNIAGATAPMYYAKTAGIYRCMFTNAAGCTKTSNSYTVNVNCRVADGGNDNDLVVYPNPAEDWLYIDRLTESDLRIEMYNMLGEKIMDQQLTDDKINIRHLPNGIYTLRLSGDTTKIVRVEVIH
jgi:hypothetical protein